MLVWDYMEGMPNFYIHSFKKCKYLPGSVLYAVNKSRHLHSGGKKQTNYCVGKWRKIHQKEDDEEDVILYYCQESLL